MTDELLTPEEVEALDVLGDLARQFASIIGHGRTRDADSREAVFHIHALQNMVLSQAAARRYPGQFRLLGETLRYESSLSSESPSWVSSVSPEQAERLLATQDRGDPFHWASPSQDPRP